MTVNSTVYEAFYELLYTTYLKKEFGEVMPPGGRGRRSPVLWTSIPEGKNAIPAVGLFTGSIAEDPLYFHLKSLELKPDKKHEGPIDDLAYFKALAYVNKHHDFFGQDVTGSQLWRAKLKPLEKAFIAKYVPAELLEDANDDENKRPGIPMGKLFRLLNDLEEEVDGLGEAGQTDIFRALKREVTDMFWKAERKYAAINPFPVLALSTDDEFAGYGFSNEERESLYEFIFDVTQDKDERKKAVTVFARYNGLTDERILKLVTATDQPLSRTAIEELPQLVSNENDRELLCKQVTDFALQSRDTGIPRRVCERLLTVDFEAGVNELLRFFPAREVGIPVRTINHLAEYISANPSAIKSKNLLSKTEELANLCLAYDPEHSKMKAPYLVVINILKNIQG